MPKNIFQIMLVSGGAAMALSLGAWQASESSAVAQDNHWRPAQATQNGPATGVFWTEKTNGQQNSGQFDSPRLNSPARVYGVATYPQSANRFFASGPMNRKKSEAEQKTEAEIRKLLEQARTSQDDNNEEVMESLRKLVSTQFDIRHEEQVAKLKKLEEQLETTRAALASREDNRDDIIDRRLKELLGQANPLDWNYQPGTSGNTFSGRASFDNLSGAPASLRPSFPSRNFGSVAAAPGNPPTPITTAVIPRGGQASLPAITAITANNQDLIGVAHAAARASSDIERIRRLAEKGVVSINELRDVELKLSEAQARLEATERSLQIRRMEAEAELNAKVVELESLKMKLAQEPSDERSVQEAASGIRIAEIELKVLEGKIAEIVEELKWLHTFKKQQAATSENEDDKERSKEIKQQQKQ